MKVQTGDDAKIYTVDKPPTYVSQLHSPAVSDLDLRSVQPNYMSLSKTCLLFLAIIATFLACLLFARDLLGKNNGLDHDLPRPQFLTSTPTPILPATDHFFDDTPNPFDGRALDKPDDKVMSKMTRITFRFKPNEAPAVISDKPEEPPFVPDMMNDMMKLAMNLMSAAESKDEQKPNEESDSSTIETTQNTQPKVIIVRKFESTPTSFNSNPSSTNFMGKFFGNSDDSSSERIGSRRMYFPFGFPRFQRHFFPFFNRMDKNERSDNFKAEETGAQSWARYKKLVSKMASSVDGLFDGAEDLKNKFEKKIALNSFKKTTTTDKMDSDKQTDAEDSFKQQLKKALNDVSQISDQLTEVSVLIKTEDAAMDLIHKTDKSSLNSTVDSFSKSIEQPLNTVISHTTLLTKLNAVNEDTDLRQDVVHFSKNVLDFGRLFSEDLHNLIKLPSADELPVVHRRIWFFKTPFFQFFPNRKLETVDNKPAVTEKSS